MNNWNIKSTHISTVISISLVLFMIGLIGLVMINAKQLSDDFKKKIIFSIMLKNNIKESDILQFNKSLNTKEYVLSATYHTKEEAMKELNEVLKSQDGDVDHLALLDGELPTLNSIDLKFNPEYTHPDSIKMIEAELLESNFIHELVFSDDLNNKIQKNSNTIAIYLLAISSVLMLIAIALINNTIRLTVYSKRFIIRSMQLVGATATFIQRPFMFNALMQGLIGSLTAIMFLIGFINLVQEQLPELSMVENQQLQLLLFAGIIVLGIFLTWLSTLLAVRKYLRKNLDQLTLG